MTKLRKIMVCGVLVTICLSSFLGCAQMPDLSASNFLHELKPYRMWRWNRGSAPSQDAYFSVPDNFEQAEKTQQTQ